MLTNFVAVTASLAATASAFSCNGNYFSFFNRDGSALSYQRIDPGLFPGTESPHLHSFDGGNVLSASMDYGKTQSSTCSTARVKTDKSLYWRPTLFFNGNGSEFYRVPEKATKIYYKFGDGDKWANVTGFPEDFNMVAGKPLKRSDGANDAGVRWGCHNPDGRSDKIFANGFPKGFKSCDYGFASEVTFPSCWNGQKMDPKNPNAHMAYPSGYAGVGIENCPTTHRAARFPTIFIEFWWDISSFNGKYEADSVPWVLSNGDNTGYGFHGDFLNGWAKGVLEKATAQTGGCNCGCGCGQAEMEQCFGAENVNKNDDPAFKSCSAAGGKSDEAAAVLNKLPGCNPIQSGPADATVVTGAGCDATAMPAPGNSKTSAALSSAAVTPSAQASSKAASSAKVVSSTKQDDADYGYGAPSATPAPSSQQYNSIGLGNKDAAKPTPVASKDDLPELSLPSTSVPAGSVSKPSDSPAGGKDGDCKAPVYVTITPTIYVTAGANSTSCGLGTVTKTLTQTATVTVDAYAGIKSASY